MRLRYLIGAVIFAALFSGSALAQTISGTSHDLRAIGIGTTDGDNGEICVYCHTPHSASADVASLWNKTVLANTVYTMYSNPATIDAPSDNTTLTSASLACLSCHDGTLAVDAVLNAPGLGSDSRNFAGTTLMGAINDGFGVVGQDLSDDHPIGMDMTLAVTNDPDIQATTYPLFGTDDVRVECATCHTVHSDEFGSFLVESNTGSTVCFNCHTK